LIIYPDPSNVNLRGNWVPRGTYRHRDPESRLHRWDSVRRRFGRWPILL